MIESAFLRGDTVVGYQPTPVSMPLLQNEHVVATVPTPVGSVGRQIFLAGTLGSCLKIGASVFIERVPRLYNITLDKNLSGVFCLCASATAHLPIAC